MEKIAVTTTTFAEYDSSPLDLLRERGYEVALNIKGRKLDGEDLLNLVRGCIGIIAGTEKYDRLILEKLSGVRVISRCGTGVESIDIKAATEAGIKVINTPDAPTQGVAEFTIGLILSLLRKVPLMDRAMRNSLWKKEMGSLLNGKRIGIIGMGRIGRKVAELLGIFEVEISFFDVKEGIRLGKCKFMEKAKLCAWADIITLHCNAGSQGQKVIGRDELSWMKKGSWLVNVARGGLIDEAELVACLKNGKLSGAAIDVFENEPYKGPLLGLENVILTPHVGSYARESRIAMELEAAKNLLAGL